MDLISNVDISKRLIIVEDDSAQLCNLHDIFADEAYSVTTCSTHGETLERLQQESFGIAIIDLRLTDGDGITLLETARALNPRLRVVIHTGFGSFESARKALNLGAFAYVEKLNDPGELVGYVHRATQELLADALRESEDRYRSLVVNAPLCIHEIDLHGRLMSMNPAGLRMMGIDDGAETDVLGQPYLDLVADQDRTDVASFLNRAYAGRASDFEFSCQVRNESKVFSSSLIPVTDATGAIVKIMGLTEDITKRKRTEERTNELLLQLVHSNRLSSMGEMASALAHEVSQPLGVIANYAGTCADLMRENRLNWTDLCKSMEEINQQTLRAGGILTRLKTFVSKTSPKTTELDVNTLCCEVDRLMQSDTRTHNVKVRLDLAERLPKVQGDAIQIQQVLVNLIRNAIESMHRTDNDQHEIVIATKWQNDIVEVSVTDRGTGIAPDDMDRIFEPYYTTKPDGLGMGLSISRTIANAHGGRLSETNNPNGGATFTLALPAHGTGVSHFADLRDAGR